MQGFRGERACGSGGAQRDISLEVDDEKNGIHVLGSHSHGVGTAYAQWKMPRFSTFLVTVENKTDAAVSFVVAINQ